ncbi:MAG TPA: transcription termination/antitermination NusG family protein [Vicinamibacterales bacterium]|nr:transcription termination/antitermination NusG family protein [Vicinamibacterales bacterium]
MAVDNPSWYALWTNSHFEQVVHDHLTARGFRTFLPMVADWSRRAGTRRLIQRPMFPGYLFIHEAIDKRKYIDIMNTRGLVRILGERWDRLAPVSDDEIESVRSLMGSGLSVTPFPYLREGQRVRIVEGPLVDVEGIFVRSRPNRGLLVLSVDLLQRSVAVEVDAAAVVPVANVVPTARVPLGAPVALAHAR